MSATESKPQSPPQPYAVVAGVSMRDLLASCAAAKAISTPPRVPDPGTVQRPAEHPKAA
ncbi:hypothetical protein [Streptomyces sp. NL15-2K]|uniref:hypothetical protein n=1 Tax=Streptomyces sp. NL15-2K TaxID=376149 RepID=UPI000FF969F4|nr:MULTISPECIES: hypothetical protein [Actinomycetes]WKX11784.1 hypothetical protein Q4V64_31470 [Kutzneria buriramensis]GCB46728.1 hypothetical protein SNL152K_4026 [Streptomyces sp. NL15-2K]